MNPQTKFTLRMDHQTIWCSSCGSTEFHNFKRIENNRGQAECAGCGERVLFFGVHLIDEVAASS